MKIPRNLLSIPALLGALPAYAADPPAQPTHDPVASWDKLWHELMIDISVIGLIFAAITVYLLIRYRRKGQHEEGKGTILKPLAAVGWVLVPSFIFMSDDIFLAAKNFELWNNMRTVPAGAYELEVKGFMWGWDVTYPEGVTTTNEMRVPAGRPIKVRLTSRDVLHSFYIPDYRVKWDLVPGMETYLWFYPKEAGEHVMTCAEFCGPLHSSMHGKVIVMPEEEFNKWLSGSKSS